MNEIKITKKRSPKKDLFKDQGLVYPVPPSYFILTQSYSILYLTPVVQFNSSSVQFNSSTPNSEICLTSF